jgi:hypothetical protein
MVLCVFASACVCLCGGVWCAEYFRLCTCVFTHFFAAVSDRHHLMHTRPLSFWYAYARMYESFHILDCVERVWYRDLACLSVFIIPSFLPSFHPSISLKSPPPFPSFLSLTPPSHSISAYTWLHPSRNIGWNRLNHCFSRMHGNKSCS